jgi:nucleotide-binding universal stress UspA family protein
VTQVHKILVPIDFSEHSQRAFAEATALAKRFRSEMHLLHCLEMLVPNAFSPYSLPDYRALENLNRDLRKAGQAQLSAWSRRATAAGVSVREHLAEDRPSVETVELARRIGADLIVMGTQGLSGLKHVLLGSVAERTVQVASCPVLTVGPAAARSTNATADRTATKEIHRILVPVDFSDHSQRALEEAVALAPRFGAEVDLLHCHQIHPQALAPYGLFTPESFERDLRVAARQRLCEWRDKASAAGCKGQDHLTAEFPFEAIAETAERLGSDLIVMGTRGLTGLKHILLGSVAERTIRTAPCPVMTVKTGAMHR